MLRAACYMPCVRAACVQAEGTLAAHSEEEQASCVEVPTALLPQLSQVSAPCPRARY